MQDILRTAERVAAPLLTVVVIFLLGRLLLFHYHLIVYPYQAEYREGADLLLTSAFARGIDPYALAVQPQYANAYGFVSNLLAAPFVALWGPSFAPGRALTALADLLSFLLLIAVMRRLGVPRLLCVVGAILFDVGLILDGSSIFARPDGLGLLLFLASLCLPWLDHYSFRSMVVSLVLALIVFHTKLYFLLGTFCLGLYVFLFISKRRAIVYGLILLLLLGVSAWIIDQRADFYFTNNFFVYLGQSEDPAWAVEQFQTMFTFYGLLWLTLILGLGLNFLLSWRATGRLIPDRTTIKSEPSQARKRVSLNLFRLSRPLIENVDSPLALFILSACVVAVLLYLKLGRNRGANYTYYCQLLVPIALVVVFTLLARLRRVRALIVLALIPTVLLTGQANVAELANGPADSSAWAHLAQVMATRHNVLSAPVLTGLLIQNQLPVYDSGSSEFFQFGYDAQHDISALYKRYQSMLRIGIYLRAFDMVVSSQSLSLMFDREDLTLTYRPMETVSLRMPYTSQTWELVLWVPQNP